MNRYNPKGPKIQTMSTTKRKQRNNRNTEVQQKQTPTK